MTTARQSPGAQPRIVAIASATSASTAGAELATIAASPVAAAATVTTTASIVRRFLRPGSAAVSRVTPHERSFVGVGPSRLEA